MKKGDDVMYCLNCGAKINDYADFCPVCGMPVASMQEESLNNYSSDVSQESVVFQEEKQKNKKRKLKGKAVLVAFVIVIALFLATVIYYFMSPAKQVIKELRESDYEQAYEIYDDEVDGNVIQEKLLIYFLKQELETLQQSFIASEVEFDNLTGELDTILRFEISEIDGLVHNQIMLIAETIKENYKKDVIGYETATEQIGELRELSDNDDKTKQLEEMLEELDELRDSKVAYEEAEEQYEAGNYSAALAQYSQVSENDSNYEDAQSKIESCTEKYRQDILEQTENPETKTEYEEAISLVTIALGVLPGDEQLTERLNLLTEEYAALLKSEALEQGTAYINEGNYADAFELINEALEYNEGDSELISFLESSQSAYEEYITEQVDAYIAVYDYESALALLETAVSTLPDSTVLAELQTQTYENQPVKLCDMKIAESENYEQITELVITQDSMGNQYNPGNLFKVSCSRYTDIENGYAKYYLNKEYTKIKGTIVASDDSEITGCVLTIYGDNQILYSSDIITRSSSPLELELDVTGIEWIHMEFSIPENDELEGVHYFRWMRVLIADAMLYKN